jgi:hypothetical protein
MVFLHINTKNYNKNNNNPSIEELNNAISNGKHVFLLIYMEGCGPCNSTRPEWSKIKNVLHKYKNDNNIYIADIDMGLIDKIKTRPPRGFPTLRYIKGKEEEDFEDSAVKNKDREVDSFVEWIELKSGAQKVGANNYNIAKTRKNRIINGTRFIRKNKNKNKKGWKWSLKYKRSINCRRPSGFSQKQYCKYGRK